MISESVAVAVFAVVITALLLSLSAARFFFRYGLWGRGIIMLVPIALAGFLTWRVAPSFFDVLGPLVERPGLALIVCATVVCVPLIVARLVGDMFYRRVIAVEDLLVKAEDTGGWDSSWRRAFVEEHREKIIENATDIQREWIRSRRAPLGLLPWFAALVLGEPRETIASYVQEDREERYRQLRHARGEDN